MIELRANKLVASFPDLPGAPEAIIDFQRTLRLPDDGRNYPLPPGLGSFPLRHIDDYAERVPGAWLDRGGVIMPMWQSEAMWLNFQTSLIAERRAAYPFAIKIATGKINAVTGEGWRSGLSRNPQDYVTVPGQQWLDGYCVEKGIVRQFVAAPLGEGCTVEEQLTGTPEFGGIQMEIIPMRQEIFEQKFPVIRPRPVIRDKAFIGMQAFCATAEVAGFLEEESMGLAPGGRMRQEIFADKYSIHDWDTARSSRCFVHLVNSEVWLRITGQVPPHAPLTALQYNKARYPWFDYYDAEQKALEGSDTLRKLKSLNEMRAATRKGPLPGNESIYVSRIVNLRAGLKPGQVRETDTF